MQQAGRQAGRQKRGLGMGDGSTSHSANCKLSLSLSLSLSNLLTLQKESNQAIRARERPVSA
jgi:hypothetical protein